MVLAMLVLAALFGGCLKSEDGPAGGTAQTGGSDGSMTSGGGTESPMAGGTSPNPTGGPENAPPAASLVALLDGESLTAENGEIALESGVEVVLDASASLDPEGDDLTFAWTLDDTPLANETASSASLSFEAGLHSIQVTVSDGAGTASADLLFNVSEVDLGPDPVIRYRFADAMVAADTNSRTSFTFEVPEGAKQVTLWLTWTDVTNQDMDLFVKNGAGTEVDAREGFEAEYSVTNAPSEMVAGTWTADVLAYLITAETPYTLDVLVWMVTPTVTTFSGTVVNGVSVGASPVQGVVTHPVTVPAGSGAVAARLVWGDANGGSVCNAQSRDLNNFDVEGAVGSTKMFESKHADACEFGFFDAGPGEVSAASAEWGIKVNPVSTAASKYTLTVEYA